MKKQRNLWMCCCSILMLAACQQGEEGGLQPNEELDLHVQASIEGSALPGRSTTNENGTTTFEESDEIGFFMPDHQQQLKWILVSNDWQPEETAVWKDKVNTFQFCAYYPYSPETTSRTEVAMPDLSSQTGTWEDLGKYDFLAARCSASYETNAGIVSFTGESAFRHVYSLVVVSLQKDLESENVTLQKEKFQGEGLFTQHSYCFADDAGQDGMVPLDSEEDPELVLTYTDGVAVETDGGHAAVILLNPSETEKVLGYTATYRRDGIDYTATTDQISGAFKAGYCYKYKLKLNKEGLTLVGNEICRWDTQEMEEIRVDEVPAL